MRAKLLQMLILMACVTAPATTWAQGQFDTVIAVNDRAITGFELDQRIKLLTLFRTPGDLNALAREQLIDDRLKSQELDRVGAILSDEALQAALEEFAGRANLTLDQFTAILNQSGVERQSLVDFVSIGIRWRDYIRDRYSRQAVVSEADVDRALGQTGSNTNGIEVLLTEIIIPAPPPEAAAAMATAERISRLTSTDAFEAEARRVSALPSRDNGGRLGWLPISNYPPQIQGLLLGLNPGEVTAPLPIQNGVALFQMRGVREVPAAATVPTAVEYAAFYLTGGRTEAGLTAARNLANQVDTCDDLYGAARGLPPEVLERDKLAPADIPQDVALELARLDPGEVSYNLTRADGQTLVFLMLCNRFTADPATLDREAVTTQLRNQRLTGLADALLADLRASARITP